MVTTTELKQMTADQVFELAAQFDYLKAKRKQSDEAIAQWYKQHPQFDDAIIRSLIISGHANFAVAALRIS